MDELENVLAIPREEVILASRQGGHRRRRDPRGDRRPDPAAQGRPGAPLQGLIFDTHYDAYKGVVVYVRLAAGHAPRPRRDPADGAAAPRPSCSSSASSGRSSCPSSSSRAGEVGYVATGLKSVRDAQVGDTMTDAEPPGRRRRCPATRRPRASSSPGIYPVSGEDYPLLRDALEKLHLNDASFTYEPESSVALGFGFRCGFLGLLHMEIVQERLEREFDLDLIAIAPSVEYHVDADRRPRRGRRRQPGAAARTPATSRRSRSRGSSSASSRRAQYIGAADGALDEPPRRRS